MKPKVKNQLKSPPSQEVKKRSQRFKVLLLALIVGFGLLAFFAKQYAYFPFDLYITREIQLISLPFFRELMLFMTDLGYILPGFVLLIIGGLGLIFLKKKPDAMILFLSTTGAVLLSIVLKIIVSRPRPDPTLIQQMLHYSSHDSFPSGHVLFFVGFIGYLLYLTTIYLPKGIIQSLTIIIGVLLLILMGMSRIYLGAHWFSDTLGAYLIGTSWLFIVIWLRHRLVDFPSQKSE